MTDDATSSQAQSGDPRASVRTAAGYGLAGLLLVALFVVLGAPLWSGALLVVAAGLVGLGVYRRDARPTWTGIVGLGAGSLGVTFAAPVGAAALVVLFVGGALFALVTTGLGETGEVPPVRPKLATRTHQAQAAGLAALWLVLVAGPLAFASTRLALASDMGTTLAVLLVAGATVLVFGLPLSTLRGQRRAVDAEELRDRTTRFGVRGVTHPRDRES